jgi:ketosteroid isomerase-like protein
VTRAVGNGAAASRAAASRATASGTVGGITVTRWLDDYAAAWERGDAEAIAALFTEDGTSANNPHAPPHRGRVAIAGYWTAELACQRDVRARFGIPLIDGDRVTVEWSATLRDPGPAAYAGCLVLRFGPDGRCAELREYWNRA